MSSKLPHTLDLNKMGLRKLELLDPNDPTKTGPIARRREYHTINANAAHPLLQGWSFHALRHKLLKPDYTVEKWDQARWDREDELFLRKLPECTAPEDADDIMPEKWKAHRADIKDNCDERLERVTKLCTSVVNKVVDWTVGNPELAPKSVSEWNRCETLQRRITDMLELLESALGESVGINALKDPNFVRRCWRSMSEEDHNSFENSLEAASFIEFGGGDQQQQHQQMYNPQPQQQQDESNGMMMMNFNNNGNRQPRYY